jgi:hypothetical protein
LGCFLQADGADVRTKLLYQWGKCLGAAAVADHAIDACTGEPFGEGFADAPCADNSYTHIYFSPN